MLNTPHRRTLYAFIVFIFLLAASIRLCGYLQASPAGASPTPDNRQNMTAGQALVLGIVEGLTEYLPVSSTGHLHLAESLMGIGNGAHDKRAADAYVICIQAGAILAVLGLYFRRVREVGLGLVGKNPDGLRLALNLLLAFLPAVVVALLLGDEIKERLFGLWPIVLAWFVGGVAILVVARRQPERNNLRLAIEQLTWRSALVIGIAQCIAMWPGISRSLVTILAGTFVGLSLPAAVEFSFLLGGITLGAATVYEALNEGHNILATFGWLNPLLGFITAMVSAIIAVEWMLAYLHRHGLGLFGYYRIVLAVVVAVLALLRIL